MEQYLIPIILVAGLLLAIVLTRWINWYTWGANQAKEEAMNKRREARATMRKKSRTKEGNDGIER